MTTRIRRAMSMVERSAWVLGFLLLAAFFALLLRRHYAGKADLARFNRARTPAPAAPALPGVAAIPLKEPSVSDFNLWASGRIKAYRESLEAPSSPLLAVLEIPRLELQAAVLEGTEEPALNRGLGHIEGTPAPGESGNVGIAGHRDGIFRCLKDIAPGDRLWLTTMKDQREYIVSETQIVSPDEVSVLGPTARPAITLVTCFPFYFAGSAPQRFIVRAYEATKDAPLGVTPMTQKPSP
jgi:sortase A